MSFQPTVAPRLPRSDGSSEQLWLWRQRDHPQCSASGECKYVPRNSWRGVIGEPRFFPHRYPYRYPSQQPFLPRLEETHGLPRGAWRPIARAANAGAQRCKRRCSPANVRRREGETIRTAARVHGGTDRAIGRRCCCPSCCL